MKQLEIIKLEKVLAKARGLLYSINKTLWIKKPVTTTTSPINITNTIANTPATKIEENKVGLVSIFLWLFFQFFLLLGFFPFSNIDASIIFFQQSSSIIFQWKKLSLLELVQEQLLSLRFQILAFSFSVFSDPTKPDLSKFGRYRLWMLAEIIFEKINFGKQFRIHNIFYIKGQHFGY